ncbi:MAG: TadE/TadG family type IV pilus assembly protein [Rhizomicrobium sp.]|jgi:Flp pilus assembly protein TadG
MSALSNFGKNREGAAAVEFGFTAPMFMLLIWVMIESGLALWTQFGLQNGVEAAARCATVDSVTCPDAAAIQAYAASNTLGMTIPVSAFSYSVIGCGDKVSASYSYAFFTRYLGVPGVTLKAFSCYPDPRRALSSMH